MNKQNQVPFALAAAAIFAGVAGCSLIPSIGPSYEEPKFEDPEFAVPDAGYPETNVTRVVISQNELARWWERFNDPILVELVEGAQTNNLSYLAAIKRLERSNYELFGSYAAFLPKFSLGGLWKRSWYNRETLSGNGKNGYAYNMQQTALDGNWEIDLFGGNRRLSEAASAMADEAGWTVADAWVALTTQIGAQYIRLRTVQDHIDVARTNLILQTETYDILRSRLDSGIGDELAVNQSAYILEQTRAAIPQLLVEEETIKNQLAILAGKTPGEFEEQLRPVATRRDWLLAPQRIEEIPLDLIRGRPDVKAAERRLAAATASIGAAKAQWFPKLFVNGTVGLQSKNGVNLFDRDSFFATLGPSVSWPIFQGGAIYANVKALEAKMDEAALNYELALETAYGDVRTAYSAYTQEYHRYHALKAAVRAATDAVSISNDLYKNGLKDFNNVIDAQRSRLQLEEAYVESRGQISYDLINLYRTLGGGLASLSMEEMENKEVK